jgi:cyclopropane fatty-acyl-phospholipid synthase-like methyltransferase
MTKFGKHTEFTEEFYKENLMGPSSVRMLDELCERLNLSPDMRVLDLGCGMGLTSIYLVKEFGAQVFATDLWVPATDNYERFKRFGLGDKIIPIRADASGRQTVGELTGDWGTIPDMKAGSGLPFADGYFDAIISIDAYHYFGREADYLDNNMSPLIKKDWLIAVSIFGLKKEFRGDVPEEMKPYWLPEVDATCHDMDWWKTLWGRSQTMTITDTFAHSCHALAWEDWLACDNPYAVGDRVMIKAENGRYFTTHGLIARKR